MAQNEVRKRQPYCGVTVTPENRRKLMKTYKETFYEQVKDDETYQELPKDELEETAEKYAKLEVLREQKHLKAWLRGDNGYKFHGRWFPVLRPLEGHEVNFSDLQKEVENILENSKTEEE